MFTSPRGGVLKPTTIDRDLKACGLLVGWAGTTFYKLRHFHASITLQDRQNVVVVSRSLGHSSVSMSWECYAHVMAGWQREVADDFADTMKGVKWPRKRRTNRGRPPADDG